MRVVVTGAGGFLGWHTCVRMRATTDWQIIPVTPANWLQLPVFLAGADAVIHIAGVNRGSEEEVHQGNIRLAEDLRTALLSSGHSTSVVYANSIQADNDTPYGRGKRSAAAILERTTIATGGRFVDVAFPNLFGERGRPGYNSFVATFVHSVVTGDNPSLVDREIELLHAQSAAQVLVEAVSGPGRGRLAPRGSSTLVSLVLRTLRSQFEVYRSGDIPPLRSQLEIDLFNQLRAAMFPSMYPISLEKRTDSRGSLVETVRAHGGGGQTFVSTTLPGITRGQHYHLRKVERFVVLAGEAQIELRRCLTDEVVTFTVNGDEPVAIDMPTLWAHNITNTGDGELLTLFWTNELFDPADTDTYPEVV